MVPPESPPKAKNIQLQESDNVAGLDIQANGTPVMHSDVTKKHPRTPKQTWTRGTTDAAMVPFDNNI